MLVNTPVDEYAIVNQTCLELQETFIGSNMTSVSKPSPDDFPHFFNAG